MWMLVGNVNIYNLLTKDKVYPEILRTESRFIIQLNDGSNFSTSKKERSTSEFRVIHVKEI